MSEPRRLVLLVQKTGSQTRELAPTGWALVLALMFTAMCLASGFWLGQHLVAAAG